MKIRSTKVDAGDFKHELLNRLRSTMAVNVLRWIFRKWDMGAWTGSICLRIGRVDGHL